MPSGMNPEQFADWKKRRQKCRTNLRFLCGVLGYRDVSKDVHGPIYNHVQKFEGGVENGRNVTILGANYIPTLPMWELQGPRKRLSLVTRGGLKTTILTQAHKIQWVINYPDIRILLGSAQLGRSKDFLRGIKEPFLKNEHFRWLFPEYCPKVTSGGHLEDFGNDEQFTVPCRRTTAIKEPTFRVCSADSSVAGGHYEVIDIDDGVEDQNTRTPGAIEQTNKFISSLWPLLETSTIEPGHGWFSLTGTIYSFSDRHFTIYSEESKKPEEKRSWSVLRIPAATEYEVGAQLLDNLEAAKEKGIAAEIGIANTKLDEYKSKHVWWQNRISLEALRKIEKDPALGPGVLFPQYLLRPLQDKNGLIKSEDDIKWIPRAELNAIAGRCNWNVTVDLAGMGTSTGGDADYECINLHGWGTDGRCYFDKIIWGRLDPDTVIEKMFWLFKYQPRIMFFKIEAEAHSRILAPFLNKAMAQRGIYLPVMEIKRDNTISKQHRIRGTQPYWKNGAFRFAEDIDPETKEHLKLEAKYFPKFNHDDILDTCADALQSRDGIVADVEGREKPLPDNTATFDGQAKEWRGIPIENLSWQALQGLQEQEDYFSAESA